MKYFIIGGPLSPPPFPSLIKGEGIYFLFQMLTLSPAGEGRVRGKGERGFLDENLLVIPHYQAIP